MRSLTLATTAAILLIAVTNVSMIHAQGRRAASVRDTATPPAGRARRGGARQGAGVAGSVGIPGANVLSSARDSGHGGGSPPTTQGKSAGYAKGVAKVGLGVAGAKSDSQPPAQGANRMRQPGSGRQGANAKGVAKVGLGVAGAKATTPPKGRKGGGT